MFSASDVEGDSKVAAPAQDEPAADGPMDFAWEDQVTNKPDSVVREKLRSTSNLKP